MDRYGEEFNALMAPLKDASEELLVGAFKNGLRPDIRALLHLFGLGHSEVMGLAQRIEEKNFLITETQEDTFKYHRTGSGCNPNPVGRNRQVLETWSKVEIPPRLLSRRLRKARFYPHHLPTVQRKSNTSLKKLIEAEVFKRKEEGLCFKCDEKYNSGHRCKNRLYKTMVLQEIDYDQETGRIIKRGRRQHQTRRNTHRAFIELDSRHYRD